MEELDDDFAGPYLDFRLIENFDKEKDCKSTMKEFNCLSLPDSILAVWWKDIESMPVYFQEYSRPNFGIDLWGVTLIPATSLPLFLDVVKTTTPSKYTNFYAEEFSNLLKMIDRGIGENKFMICFGV